MKSTTLLPIFIIFLSYSSNATNYNVFEPGNKNKKLYYDILSDEHSQLPDSAILYGSGLSFYELEDSKKRTIPNKTYWLRFVIDNRTNESLILYSGKFLNFDFFYPDSSGRYQKKSFVTTTPVTKRDIYYNIHLTPIEKSIKPLTYYIKVKCHVNVGLGYLIYSNSYAINHVILNSTYYSLYIGCLVMFIGFNIIMFFKLKQAIYLYYGGYLFFLALSALTSWAFVGVDFLSTVPNFFQECIPFAFITVFLMLYVREFIKEQRHPIIDKCILAAIFLRIGLLIVALALNENELHNPLFDNILLLPCVVGIWYSYKKDYTPARFLLASFVLILIGFVYHATFEKQMPLKLFLSEELSMNFRDMGYFFFNSSLLEVVLFSLALAERVIKIKRENEKSHKATIASQKLLLAKAQENERLKDEFATSLQKQVEQRTQELAIANQQLQQQAEAIAQMNALLQRDNESLSQNLEMLQKARVMDSNASFDEFKRLFPDENACIQFLAEIKWKNGYSCKKCGYKKYYEGQYLFSRKCKSCGYDESATAHGLMDNVKFSYQKALYIVFASYTFKKLNVNKLAEEIQLRTGTCYNFHNKVLEIIENKQRHKHDTEGWVSVLG